MKAEYRSEGGVRYLVLRIRRSKLEKIIPVKDIGGCCDHDYLMSDCGRCWDCGRMKSMRYPPLNWTLPKFKEGPIAKAKTVCGVQSPVAHAKLVRACAECKKSFCVKHLYKVGKHNFCRKCGDKIFNPGRHGL